MDTKSKYANTFGFNFDIVKIVLVKDGKMIRIPEMDGPKQIYNLKNDKAKKLSKPFFKIVIINKPSEYKGHIAYPI